MHIGSNITCVAIFSPSIECEAVVVARVHCESVMTPCSISTHFIRFEMFFVSHIATLSFHVISVIRTQTKRSGQIPTPICYVYWNPSIFIYFSSAELANVAERYTHTIVTDDVHCALHSNGTWTKFNWSHFCSLPAAIHLTLQYAEIGPNTVLLNSFHSLVNWLFICWCESLLYYY